VLREVLTPQTPLFVSTDQPAEEVVRSFLAANWERIVERCNARA